MLDFGTQQKDYVLLRTGEERGGAAVVRADDRVPRVLGERVLPLGARKVIDAALPEMQVGQWVVRSVNGWIMVRSVNGWCDPSGMCDRSMGGLVAVAFEALLHIRPHRTRRSGPRRAQAK